MKTMKKAMQRKKLVYAVCAFCVLSVLGALVFPQSVFARDKVIIASTSWVAAIAQAAGAENIRILAPVTLQHPPEYELKPSDLRAASKADIILYAGWEVFAEKLADTAGSAGVQMIQVNTTMSPESIKAEAKRLSEIFGTQAKYEKWAASFDKLTTELRQKIQAASRNKTAVVQRMQTDYAKWAGLNIIGEWGPAEPSPAVILSLVKLKPDLVIDNYHGPSGEPIAEAAKASYVQLINFPGKGGTKTIDDVFRYNAELLIKAAKK